MADFVFGNPWHGRLGTDSIELVPSTPVTSIAVDGTEYAVKEVTGNLGDTRYYLSPDLTDPVTPGEISALDGEFKKDMVIYSDEFRWTPLHDEGVLSNSLEWLLWDSTAFAWRKMKISFSWHDLSTNKEAVSSQGSNLVTVTFYKGDIFGKISRDPDTTAVSTPTWTSIGSTIIPYRWTGDDVLPGLFSPWKPSSRGLTLDAKRDGRSVLLRIYAVRSWADQIDSVDYENPANQTGIDPDSICLQDVWEVSLNSAGTQINTATQLIPPQVSIPATPEDQTRTLSTGSPYYQDSAWYVPVEVERKTSTGPYGLAFSSLITAAYDKNGSACLEYLLVASGHITTYTQSADAYIGFDPEAEDPSAEPPYYPTGPSSWTNDSEWIGILPTYENSLNFSQSGFTYSYDTSVKVMMDSTTLEEWADFFSDTCVFSKTTNNVTSIDVGTESVARVGPGAIDATVMDLPVYASFNPRTGVIVSSESPIGFV